MAKVFIEESTLTAIGDAIRGKEGTSELIPTTSMASRITAIPTGGGGGDYFTDDDLTTTGVMVNSWCGKVSQKIMDTEGTRLKFNNITQVNYCFGELRQGVNLQHYVLNLNNATLDGAFANSNAGYLPELRGSVGWIQGCMFQNCNYLKALPVGLSTLDFSGHTNAPIGCSQMFNGCHSLKSIPQGILPKFLTSATYEPLYYWGWYNCYVLSDLYDIPVWAELDMSNYFDNAFNDCHRLKTIKFETNADGTPKTARWSEQFIDLTQYVGYVESGMDYRITAYNSGITTDSKVSDATSYEKNKDHPYYWASTIGYSRYNGESAMETIRSLPDTSEFLSEVGGSNVIKFALHSGEDTGDGFNYSISVVLTGLSDLTSEDLIALASSKGWTVAFDE